MPTSSHGDNDDTMLIWARAGDGRTLASVGWDEARARLAVYFDDENATESAVAGHLVPFAEDMLCAIFTGHVDNAAARAVRDWPAALKRLSE